MNHLQLSNQTRDERFPKIYDRLLKYKPQAKRIVCFGCSFGNECHSMRKRFPDAEIVGIEINDYVRSRARQDNEDKNIHFQDSISATGMYDIATSIMVLFSLSDPISLEKWKQTVDEIDVHINIGGVWAIYTSQYPFSESNCFNNYKKIREWTVHRKSNDTTYYCGYYKKLEHCFETMFYI